MADLSVFEDGAFDLIVNPPSTLFVPDLQPVFRECHRVLRPVGHLLMCFMNPDDFVFDADALDEGRFEVRFPLPYVEVDTLSEEQREERVRAGQFFHFSHTMGDQLGRLTEDGFAIIGFYEDRRPDWDGNPLRHYLPQLLRRARRTALTGVARRQTDRRRSGGSAASFREVGEGNLPDQGIGVPVHDLPPVASPAEDDGDPERPVLAGQTADLSVLSFDGDQHDQVAGDVGVLDLQVRFTGGEEAARGVQILLGRLEADPRLTAVRRHQRVVGRVVEQREVAPDVSTDVGGRGIAHPGRELGHLHVIDRHVMTVHDGPADGIRSRYRLLFYWPRSRTVEQGARVQPGSGRLPGRHGVCWIESTILEVQS